VIALALVLPLSAGAILLLVERYGLGWQRALSALFAMAGLLLSFELLALADRGAIIVELIGNWPSNVGIVLQMDRFAALLLALSAALGLVAALYAARGADAEAPHFHALLQFQLLGLNGAFLTGDLFNLFVWFEVLLISSYGLLLHGARAERLAAGMKYVIFNLLASALFLIGLGLLFGVVGSLNMVDVAVRFEALTAPQQALAQAAALLLLLVFAIKAALLPLYFWLPGTYGAAPAAAAVLFAVMTKVGVYATVRVFALVFPAAAWDIVMPLGLATLLIAGIGALVAPTLARLCAYWTIASAGTLLATFALGRETATAAAVNYLLPSTLLGALLFLLVDLVRRARDGGDRLSGGGAMARIRFLAPLLFLAMLAAVALPPSPGFLAKAMVLQAALGSGHTHAFWLVLLAVGFLMLLSFAHAFSQLVWHRAAGAASDVRALDFLLPVVLTAVLATLSVRAADVDRWARATAAQLHDRVAMIDAVRAARPKDRPEIAP
jgi:multicomponent K+:H+ antiporter subunit D